MPTYEYKCDACDHAFERFQSITAAPIKKCPECGKNKVRRLLGTGAGLIFKGSGFYITDYRDSNYKDAAKKDTGSTAAASSDAKPSGGGETKAAASTESKPASTPAPAPAPAAPSGGQSNKSSKK